MFRAYVGVALGCFVLVLAGCGNRAQGVKGKPAGQKAPAADAAEITIYVEGMSERQGITWASWRNKVQEALSGLPGVEEVTSDWKKDLLQVRYQPASVTQEQLLQAIGKEGFMGKVQAN